MEIERVEFKLDEEISCLGIAGDRWIFFAVGDEETEEDDEGEEEAMAWETLPNKSQNFPDFGSIFSSEAPDEDTTSGVAAVAIPDAVVAEGASTWSLLFFVGPSLILIWASVSVVLFTLDFDTASDFFDEDDNGAGFNLPFTGSRFSADVELLPFDWNVIWLFWPLLFYCIT